MCSSHTDNNLRLHRNDTNLHTKVSFLYKLLSFLSHQVLYYGSETFPGPKPGFPCHFFDDINERAGIIYKIMLASKCLEHIKIIAFVGPQNGGKTTLINALLSDEVATVGFTSHTSKVVPYLVDGSTVIVDFPGTEATSDRQEMPAAWEEFQRVPELCVVVVKLSCYTSSTAEQMPKLARKHICKMQRKLECLMPNR